MGAFRNSVVRGIDLVRQAIRSPNFDPGTSGWQIAKDGSAEFNEIVARGNMEFPTGDPAETAPGSIDAYAPALNQGALRLRSPVMFLDNDGVATIELHHVTHATRRGRVVLGGDLEFDNDKGLWRTDDGDSSLMGLFGVTDPIVNAEPPIDGTACFVQAGSNVVNFGAANPATINFANAFPNGVITVVVSNGDASPVGAILNTETHALGSFKVRGVSDAGVALAGLTRVNWVAVGH